MNKKLLKKAKKLAARHYNVQYVPDVDTDGNSVVFARIPEMPGCVAHGDTVEEAMEWIELAKIDFIYFYLEDGMMPPEPAGCQNKDAAQPYVLELNDQPTESATVGVITSRLRFADFKNPTLTFQYVNI